MKIVTTVILSVAFGSVLWAQRGGTPIAPRILSFEARPATIRPGESAVLVWQTEAARGLTIEPQLGPVELRGTRQITPAQTTTYTLRASDTVTKSVTVTVAGIPVARPPANAAARPDFSGVYGSAGLPAGATPPPLKPGAEKFRIVRGPTDVRGRTTLVQECVPLGIPQTYITPYPWQFIQTPKMMVQVFEYPSAVRFIPLDGRPLPVDPDPAWMGTAVGRWEGETLVVESAGYNDKTEVHSFLHTDALKVTERFKKLDNGSLQYEVTVEDPNVWAGPWVIPARTFPLRRETDFVSEFVCDAPPVDCHKLFGQD
jgi:hypothetical protein